MAAPRHLFSLQSVHGACLTCLSRSYSSRAVHGGTPFLPQPTAVMRSCPQWQDLFPASAYPFGETQLQELSTVPTPLLSPACVLLPLLPTPPPFMPMGRWPRHTLRAAGDSREAAAEAPQARRLESS